MKRDDSEVLAPATSKTNNETSWRVVRHMWSHLRADATAGAIVGMLLWVMTWYGPGGHHALGEAYEHFVYVHPLFWLLAVTSICYLNAFQGADLVDDVGFYLARPILSFVAHPSGVAVGLVPVLLVAEGVPKHVDGPTWISVGLVTCMPALLAVLSHIGLAIANKEAPLASRRQVRIFAGAGVAGTFAVFYFAAKDLTAHMAVQQFPGALIGCIDAGISMLRSAFGAFRHVGG